MYVSTQGWVPVLPVLPVMTQGDAEDHWERRKRRNRALGFASEWRRLHGYEWWQWILRDAEPSVSESQRPTAASPRQGRSRPWTGINFRRAKS